MKQLGRVLCILFAMVLAVVSLQAVAETQLGGRDFNHTTTGFPLSGGHATAACETCHVGGIFKGTPRNCDGCHALGRRVVATPKSTSHLVTDAPCESCHFNTATFLGARYNHSSARPGDCTSCHNGRIASGKPNSHNIGKKATDSCDHCHRSSTFFPASWNHTGVVPGSCKNAGCHDASNQYNTSAAIRTTGKTHNNFSYTSSQSCDVCHSVIIWRPARHMPLTGTCSGCHDGAGAEGKISGHIATTDECSQCHTSTYSWLPALGAKPANHIPYNAGVQCSSCHIGGTVATGATLHAYVSPTCKTCHNSSPVYLGRMTRKTLGSHEGSSTSQDCTDCHARQYNGWNKP